MTSAQFLKAIGAKPAFGNLNRLADFPLDKLRDMGIEPARLPEPDGRVRLVFQLEDAIVKLLGKVAAGQDGKQMVTEIFVSVLPKTRTD